MRQDLRREAEAPWQMSARGWADILRRAWTNTGKKNLSLVAGGVAYYLLMALFPALAALVSAYGLLMNAARPPRFLSVVLEQGGDQGAASMTEEQK